MTGSGRNVQALAPMLNVDMAMAILDWARVCFGEGRTNGLQRGFERLLVAAADASRVCEEVGNG